jgi:hypothetical protein
MIPLNIGWGILNKAFWIVQIRLHLNIASGFGSKKIWN